MARITIEDCLDKIPNRFELTLAARDKPTVIALREVAAGKVGIEMLLKAQS